MRLLADENFPRSTVALLREKGHDVLWVRTACPGEKDTELLNMAEADDRIVLTFDKDFWQIALQRRAPLTLAGVVLFRVHPGTADRIEPLVRTLLESGRDWRGHVSTISAFGIQMVPSKER